MASSFMAGFAQGATKVIDEKRNYIRETVDRRREELRQQGYDRLNQTRALRQELQQAADMLSSAGMSQENIVALLEDSPTNLSLVAQNVSRMAMAGEPPQNINNLVRFANDARPSGLSLTEAINNAAPGIIRANEGVTDPSRRERNNLAALFGLSTEAALQRDVYGQELVEGFTGADIAASTNVEPITSARRGSVQLDYDVFRPEEAPLELRDGLLFVENIANTLRGSVEQKIEALRGQQGESVDPAIQQEIMALEQILDQPSDSFFIQEVLQAGIGDEEFNSSVNQTFSRFLESMPGILDTRFFSPEFVDMYTGTEPQTEEGVVRGIVTPEVTATPLDEEGQTTEAFDTERLEQTFDQRSNVAEQVATVINGIDTYTLTPAKQKDFEAVAEYNSDTETLVPNEDFVTWLSQDPTRIEDFTSKSDVVIQDYLVQTGVIDQAEVTRREVADALGDLNDNLLRSDTLNPEYFSLWREANGILYEDVAREEALKLLRAVRPKQEDFMAWLQEDQERLDRFNINPMGVLQEFEESF